MLDHIPIIMIISGYTLARKTSMENTDQSEWVPNYLCENLRRSSLKDSVTELSDLIVI